MSAEATHRGPLESVSPVGIFRTDADGGCLSVNARWCEIAGITLAEARGEGWARALHPDDRERVFEEWSRATREDRSFESEFRFRHPDGAIIQVLVQGLPQQDASGRTSGFIGTVTDLTRHIQLEDQVAVRNEELRCLALQLVLAQEQERRRIAAGLHDEIGQLLAVARAKLGPLVEPGAGSDAPVLVAEIRALLDRAIGETRALTFELATPVLHELGLAAAVESLCEQLEKESGVQFRVEAEPEPESLDEDLRILLYRAVRELCINIVKHSRAPRAEVRLHVEAARIRIAISDDGEGFDASQRTRRFGPGGGFGLFGIREIAGQIGARFEIESSAGKGTRAVLSVPLG